MGLGVGDAVGSKRDTCISILRGELGEGACVGESQSCPFYFFEKSGVCQCAGEADVKLMENRPKN